jgi:hypothetical protein
MARFRSRRTTATASLSHESVSHSSGGSWHLVPWLWPWAVPIALLPLAGALWLLWGDPPSVAGGAGITLLTVGAAWLAQRAGEPRGPLIRGLAVLTVVLCGSWLLLATGTGLISWPAGQWWPALVHPTVDLWVVLLFACGLGWTILKGLRSQGGDHNNGWGDLAGRIGLEGSRVVRRRGPDGKMTDVIEVPPGMPASAIAKARPGIASLLDVPVDQVQTTVLDEGGRRARLDVVADDPLRQPLLWAGPSNPGASIAEALLLGGRRDITPMKIWLPGDQDKDRAATHLLITGMSRAGKSTAGRGVLTEILSRVDVDVVVLDTFKGAQFVAAFRGHPRVQEIITEPARAKAYITSLDDEIRRRTDELGEGGWEQWAPGCTWLDGTPMHLLVVHIEEAQHTVGQMRALARVAQGGLSAGVHLIVSLQRAIDANLLTDIRQQMGAVWAFGVKRGDEKYSGLPEEMLVMGAAPQQWEANHPGYSYLTAPGVPLETALVPGRSFKILPAEIPGRLGFNRAMRTPQQRGRDEKPATTVSGRELVGERLEKLINDGVREVRPADFRDIAEAGGHTASWLTRELAFRVGERRLRPAGGGRYEVLT